jgi:hypothetical protein
LKGRDPSRYADLEVRWLALVAAMKSGKPASEVRAQAAALAGMLDALGGDAGAPPTARASSSMPCSSFSARASRRSSC